MPLSEEGGGVGSSPTPVHPKSINEPRTVAATPDTARRVLATLGRRAPCCASNMPGNLPSRCPIRTGASESVDEGAPQRRRGGLVHPMPEGPRPHSALTEGPRAQRLLRPPVGVRRHPVALELARPLGVVLDLDDLPGCHALLALAPQ